MTWMDFRLLGRLTTFWIFLGMIGIILVLVKPIKSLSPNGQNVCKKIQQ